PVFSVTVTSSADISTLSLHDALPISNFTGRHFSRLTYGSVSGIPPTSALEPLSLICSVVCLIVAAPPAPAAPIQIGKREERAGSDRKSTRLNSSHEWISYAVFCLKKQ